VILFKILNPLYFIYSSMVFMKSGRNHRNFYTNINLSDCESVAKTDVNRNRSYAVACPITGDDNGANTSSIGRTAVACPITGDDNGVNTSSIAHLFTEYQ